MSENEAPMAQEALPALETTNIAESTETAQITENPDSTATESAIEPKRRRRISSRALFVSAVVLGVLGGVGTGYAIQASRPDTPLPPLVGAQPQYGPIGVYAGIAPSPLPASQDDMTLTDGDLTKLLLPTPAGATVGEAWDHQWIGVIDNAELCSDEVGCFSGDMMDQVRAIADTGWTTKSGYFEEVRIFRFDPSYDTESWLQDDNPSQYTSLTTPADLSASAITYNDPSQGGNIDFGTALHGDLVVEFWVTSNTNVPDPSLINSLMTQQMARL
jgi:hypothetical protein